MATKVFQKDIWIERDIDGSLWGFFKRPEKNENGACFYRLFENLYNREVTDIQEELNLTNINKPHKIKVKLIFENLPDSSESSEKDIPDYQIKVKQLKKETLAYYNYILLLKEEYELMCKTIEHLDTIKTAYTELKELLKSTFDEFENKQ